MAGTSPDKWLRGKELEGSLTAEKRGQYEVAPEKQTRELRPTFLPLELLRTPIAQRLMQPLPIIELLDILNNRHLGLRLILKLSMMDQLVLE
jgi:hypothetical protein